MERGKVNDELIEYYAARARGGFGLIIVGFYEEKGTTFTPKSPYLIGYYKKLLEEELYLIEQMRDKVNSPCLINEHGELV